MRAAFGLAAAPGASIAPVSRGANGQIWRLDLGAERYAVKEALGQPDETLIQAEVAYTSHLAAAGIRLPRSLPGQDGRFLVRLGKGSGADWLRLYEWVDGASPDLTDPGVATRIGDLLGRMHAHAPPPRGPVDPWYEAAPEHASWDPLADAAQAQGLGWGKALARQVGLLRELAGLVTPMARERMVTCHRDLHPDNVLAVRSGDLIPLDWEECGPACPDQELAGLLLFWHVEDGAADDAAVQRTLGAYLAARGSGRVRDELSFGMYVAGRLNFLHGQVTVALDPRTSAADRDYASAEVQDTLARLPAPALISHLVSVAATEEGAD